MNQTILNSRQENGTLNYDVGNKIIYNTEVLKPNLCDYSNTYILVRGDITVMAAPATQVSFKTFAPFTKCITEIGKTIDDSQDLDLGTPMYNLIEYISNYSETTGSLWFYSKDETTNFDFDADIGNNNFKSFEYKFKVLENTVAQPAPNQASGTL